MFLRLIRTIAAVSFAISSSVASGAWLGAQHYLSCKSDSGLSLTFKFNNITRTVRSLDFHRELKIVSWDSETVNTSFHVSGLVPPLIFSSLVDSAVLNFDRVNGTAILIGLATPTEKYIQECTLKENSFGCQDKFVVDYSSLTCTVVEPAF